MSSPGRVLIVCEVVVCRCREELSLDGAPPQVFGAFRSGRWSPVRFLENDGLAAANREAVLHVASNEVALNAVVIPVCSRSHSPEEHQVLVSGT